VEYIKVQWIHNFDGEPILLYSELDNARLKIRKIEIFRDQSIGWAGNGESQGNTHLGKVPVPRIEEIASDPQFKPELISVEIFNQVWLNRFKKNLQ
jgi:hypothetical protein